MTGHMFRVRFTGGHPGPLFQQRAQVWSGQAGPMMQRHRTFHGFNDLLQTNIKEKRNKQQIKIMTRHRP